MSEHRSTVDLADRIAYVYAKLPEGEKQRFTDDLANAHNPSLTVYAWEESLRAPRGCVCGGCDCGKGNGNV